MENFSVDKANKKITVRREFAAGKDKIWDAFTKKENLDQWWAPQPWQAKTKSMDFKEGGKWLYAMESPEGEQHWSFVNYKTIKPNEYYTGLDGFSDAEGNVNTALPQTEWKLSFNGDDKKTLVTTEMQFTNEKDMDTLIEMGFKEGYEIAATGLDKIIASGKL